MTKLRKSVPPNVAAAVAKALEKLPADRFAMRRPISRPPSTGRFTTRRATQTAQALGHERRWRRIAIVASGAALACTALSVWALLSRPTT